MLKLIKALALGAAIATLTVASAQSQDHDLKPTVVLVHGAFAESSSWDAVIVRLTRDGYVAIAAATVPNVVRPASAFGTASTTTSREWDRHPRSRAGVW